MRNEMEHQRVSFPIIQMYMTFCLVLITWTRFMKHSTSVHFCTVDICYIFKQGFFNNNAVSSREICNTIWHRLRIAKGIYANEDKEAHLFPCTISWPHGKLKRQPWRHSYHRYCLYIVRPSAKHQPTNWYSRLNMAVENKAPSTKYSKNNLTSLGKHFGQWYRDSPLCLTHNYPDSKVHGANMGLIWGRQHPGGSHVGPMNLAIWVDTCVYSLW